MTINFNYNLDTVTTTSGILTHGDTGGFKVAAGDNVANKPAATGNNGLIRYNTTSNRIEAVMNGVYSNLTIASDVAGVYLATAGGTMTGQLLITAGSTSVPGISFSTDSTTGMYQPGTGVFGIVTGNTERLRVDATGYLLVGITSNATTYTGSSTYSSNILSGGSASDALTLVSTNSSNGTNLDFANVNSASTVYRYGVIKALPTTLTAGSESGALTFGTASSGSDANASERMRITASGAVLIGTTTILQSAALTVNGYISATTPSTGDSTTKVATTAFVTTAVGAANPVGTIITLAVNTVPAGYLSCSGQAVSRTTYANLFTALGVVYGNGDGATTFNLPDLRGQFVRGFDAGRGVDPGRTFGSAQASSFASHGHTAYVSDPSHAHTIALYNAGGNSNIAGNSYASQAVTSYNQTGISVSIAASGGSDTYPVNVAMLYCIKY